MNPFQLLQAAPSIAASPLVQMVPYVLMFVIFYFVLLAPMRKQQKKQKELLAALKKGDRVVTSGGIHGTIAQVEDQIVWLKIADTVKIKVNRSRELDNGASLTLKLRRGGGSSVGGTGAGSGGAVANRKGAKVALVEAGEDS